MQDCRVLLVDDFPPWRSYVKSTLQQEFSLQIIGETADGLEAVERADELQPDLILLDISLPGLNGIEAALRMRERLPEVKILFVSELRSCEIVEAALRTGASGYLVKSQAATELLPAVRAVLRGERFIGSCITLLLDGTHGD